MRGSRPAGCAAPHIARTRTTLAARARHTEHRGGGPWHAPSPAVPRPPAERCEFEREIMLKRERETRMRKNIQVRGRLNKALLLRRSTRRPTSFMLLRKACSISGVTVTGELAYNAQ